MLIGMQLNVLAFFSVHHLVQSLQCLRWVALRLFSVVHAGHSFVCFFLVVLIMPLFVGVGASRLGRCPIFVFMSGGFI